MSKIDFKIHINHNAYYPGNIVEGVVELSIPKGESVAYNSIRLSLTGKERTRHHVKRRVDGDEVKAEDTERNLFFKEVIVLAGEMSEGGNPSVGRTVNEGLYRYPFAYKLPLDIPASVSKGFDKTDYAEILYQAKAVVIKPDTERHSEKEVKKLAARGLAPKPVRAFKAHRYFHVLRPMPLSQYDDKKTIVRETPFHLKSCGCCDAGNHIQFLEIDRSVVAIDRDNLQVVINLDNLGSKKAVSGLQLKLKQNFTFRCNDYTKSISEDTVSKETFKQPIPAGAKGVLSGICPIPINTIPSFKTFNMTCNYILSVKVLMDGCKDQEQNFPVTIVQSVDDTNTAPRIVYTQNSYHNLIGGGVKEGAYVPPTASTILGFNPVPTDVPRGTPTKAIGAVNEGNLALPSEFWQVVPKESKDRMPHVDGAPVKYETMVWTGGLQQKQLPVYPKSTDVKFKANTHTLPVSVPMQTHTQPSATAAATAPTTTATNNHEPSVFDQQ